MPTYSYARCLQNAYKVNWKIDELLGDRQFDVSKRWLPAALTGVPHVTCLNEEEKRKLTQVEMASYAHLFGYVEEFVAPKVIELAQDFAIDGREAFDALTNFAAEEVKHMTMFRRLRDRRSTASCRSRPASTSRTSPEPRRREGFRSGRNRAPIT